MFSIFRRRTEALPTLEQKLAILSRCGLSLAPEFTIQELLESCPRETLEEPGFTQTLVSLGMTEEQPPWRNHCVNVWHFDTECIEDEGSYVRIAYRMAEMTQGALVIEDVQDEVDTEVEVANLAFKHAGKPVHLDLKVKSDWVDPAVFSVFVRLLAASDPSKIFLFFDTKGQDCIIACVSQEQYAALSKAGVDFQRLK